MSDSYVGFFGHKDQPFTKEIADKDLWLPSSKAALVSELVEALEERASVLLTGEPGVGKTCVLRALRARLPEAGFRLTYCHNATLGRRDFYRQLCLALGLSPHATAASVFYAVATHVEDLAKERVLPVFLLDEAHLLHEQMLGHLHILLNYEWDSKALLSLVLVGLPELKDLLGLRRYRSLYSRLHVRLHIDPLTPEDTAEYLRHRMKRAGVEREVFTVSARISPSTISMTASAATVARGATSTETNSILPTGSVALPRRRCHHFSRCGEIPVSRRNAVRVRPLASNAASATRPSASLQYRPPASSRSRAWSAPPIFVLFATVTSVAEPASMTSGSTGAVHRALTLLRQRGDGELVLDAQVRAWRTLREPRRRQGAIVRLHRGVLQPAAKALGARLCQPRRVREGSTDREVSGVVQLSTESDQAQVADSAQGATRSPLRRSLPVRSSVRAAVRRRQDVLHSAEPARD